VALDRADNAHEATALVTADEPTRNFNTAKMQQTLQNTMQDDVGALRSGAKLTAALDTIGRLTDELGSTPPGDGKRFDMRRIDWFDMRNMLLVARAVAAAALARTETRGAQQREDYPQLSPDWAFNQTVTLAGSRIELSGGPHATAVTAS
jgi:succinate dehydrogenase/fumarate reductase flavoprotein subunit